jgi:hypothetical protein
MTTGRPTAVMRRIRHRPITARPTGIPRPRIFPRATIRGPGLPDLDRVGGRLHRDVPTRPVGVVELLGHVGLVVVAGVVVRPVDGEVVLGVALVVPDRLVVVDLERERLEHRVLGRIRNRPDAVDRRVEGLDLASQQVL